ncbi:MaoC family dehydratase N-terminal domain-containing protein [Thermoactinomyces mirandus]|uniref:MaoC family dehydratase N-terminal domain-containing protein n=1 Tax=Thermoactinomyces mirandus TaxID=2756294 RepID=A0A7W1XU88_9BACL|nr:MaoC family dehydratase N-terminal domain-containing protein [Thermoactinomyces mirandus]MBA4603404.1 MaoC family dehydratase N-terminal domain-containing protein [Thermoactinomyces mirandus]
MNLSQFQAFVGVESTPVKNEVEKGAIRKFADAIGDSNPIYRDEEYAKKTRYGKIIAPPTFSRTFDYGELPGFSVKRDGLIHGEQHFEYFRPIYAGEVLYCSTRLADVYEKKGKLGRMIFLVYEQKGTDEEGKTVFIAWSNVIYRAQEGGFRP